MTCEQFLEACTSAHWAELPFWTGVLITTAVVLRYAIGLRKKPLPKDEVSASDEQLRRAILFYGSLVVLFCMTLACYQTAHNALFPELVGETPEYCGTHNENIGLR